jgi:hypothetical protein
MSHLVDIDRFPSNGESGTGKTWLQFNQLQADALGKGIFVIDLIEDGLQLVLWDLVHLEFSSPKAFPQA